MMMEGFWIGFVVGMVSQIIGEVIALWVINRWKANGQET